MAGTADLEEMRGAIDLVREGFLAWLAVDPDEDTSSIAPLLARAVLDSMSRRGMTRVWISWEVSAGSCDEEWLRQFVGPEERRVEYHIFSRTRDRR
ncbi:MAG: hypothetical protein IPK20_21625 [Betaproteobacteria bacterium]|nr:hypothetical protein [Betaproteobacteria bacterium]